MGPLPIRLLGDDVSDAVGASDAPDASPRRGRPTKGLQPASGPVGHTPTGRLLDTLRVAVVMLDTAGRIVLWSPPAEEMLGWAGEHVVGRRVGYFLDTRDPSTGFARGRQVRSTTVPVPGAGERILAQLLRIGRWNGILPLRHRDGHTVQVEARASLLVDGDGKPFVLASMAETSAIRTVEHDLAVLDSLFDSSPLGIAIFDTQLRYVRINGALARMNGLTPAAHLGRTDAEIFGDSVIGGPGEAQPGVEELSVLQRHVLTSGVPVVDMTLMSPTGGYHSVSYSRLEDRGGRVLGLSCTVMDVTERQESVTKVEQSRQRLALLNDIGSRLGDLLDVGRIAEELAAAVVPVFSDYSGVILLQDVALGGELPLTPHSRRTPLVQLGVGAVDDSPVTHRMLGLGERIAFSADSAFETVLRTGIPQVIDSGEQLRRATFPGDPKVQAAIDLGIHSLMVLPLRARGIVLGLLVISRGAGRGPFDRDDLALAMELADRAGVALDNARLYSREREGALMLQRSLLPQIVPAFPGVEVAFRYQPGSSGTEVGGDWFDVIALAGGRVAFVVGDVMGHGLRAAATMGRLRTAVRTLSQLDLPPDKLLRHVNSLADDLAHGPDEPLMATCVYAVYDPATRRVCVAKAGHLPPLLIEPGGKGHEDQGREIQGRDGRGNEGGEESLGRESPGHDGEDQPDKGQGGEGADAADRVVRQLDLPSGAPLGVGGVEFESLEFEVADGSVLVMYTDGLVEFRGEDIGVGIDRLCALLRRDHSSLEDLCDSVLEGLDPGREPDDVAVLMARLGGLPEGSSVSWTFPADPAVVARARGLVRATMAEWHLEPLEAAAELLVSELVTNSLRYAHGPIGLRLMRGTALLVEVSDPLPDPPQERRVSDTDEGGRGLQLVARTARRWGTRHGPSGKVVWFELALPGS